MKKKLICFLILGAMVLLLTACDGATVMKNFVRMLSEYVEEVAVEENAAGTQTASPEPTEMPAPAQDDDELPWIPA